MRIVAPHFVAAFEAEDRVVRAAPIIKYMVGWDGARVAGYCRSRNWTWERVA